MVIKTKKLSAADRAKALARYCDLKAEGKSNDDALEASGMANHAAADLAWYGDSRNPNAVPVGVITLPAVPAKDEPGYESALNRRGLVIAELRIGEHAKFVGQKLSWGQIAVICGITESAVRKAFTATGVASEGTRKGRGGRFLNAEPRLYLGNRKGIGVEDAKPRAIKPDAAFMKASQEAKSVLPTATKRLKSALAKKAGTTAKRTRKGNGQA